MKPPGRGKNPPPTTEPPRTNYQIVPKEPTHDQIEAAYPLIPGVSIRQAKEICRLIYLEMLLHAPRPRRGGLTMNQRRVHEILTEAIDNTNLAPTLREIARLAGFSGHPQAWRTIRSLKRKGIINVGSGPRDIELVRRPEET